METNKELLVLYNQTIFNFLTCGKLGNIILTEGYLIYLHTKLHIHFNFICGCKTKNQEFWSILFSE